MRALVFHGPGDVRHETVPDPAIVEAGDAVVRVRLSAICGSDLHPYEGRERCLDPGTVMGHELVGEVVAVGDKNLTYRAGRSSARHCLEGALAVAGSGRHDLGQLWSERLPLEPGPDGYRRFARREPGTVKLALVP